MSTAGLHVSVHHAASITHLLSSLKLCSGGRDASLAALQHKQCNLYLACQLHAIACQLYARYYLPAVRYFCMQAIVRLFLVGSALGLLWECPLSCPGWVQQPARLLRLLRPRAAAMIAACCFWDGLICLVRDHLSGTR